jgi:hypothetical protein
MDRRNRHKYDTGTRVSGFFASRLAEFPPETHASTFIAILNAMIGVIAGLFSDQARAWSKLRMATQARAAARETVAEDVRVTVRTARGLALDTPEAAPRFQRQPGESDQSLLATARAFLSESRLLADDLAKHGLTAAFLDGFNDHIEAFNKAIGEQNAAQATHTGIRLDIVKNAAQMMTAIRHLDVIVRNQFRGDATTLQLWARARHVDTGPVSDVPEEPAPTPTPPPDTQSGTKVA